MTDDTRTDDEPDTPLTTEREGSIDEDRQDPPAQPQKGTDDDLDGMKPTPGDDA